MSELVAPKVVGEDELIIEEWGKRVFRRSFEFSHGVEKFLLWGGAKAPIIIFPVTPEYEVIVLRQFRIAANQFIFELPGGNPTLVDKPEEVAIKELRDETGFTADRLFQVGPTKAYFDPATDVNHYVPFLATGCRQVAEPRLKRTEILERMTLSISDWIQKIWEGEVSDSKSIATTLLALPHLGYDLKRLH